MVIDTLFLCFCEDYNKNDGSPGREYYAPPSLMVIIRISRKVFIGLLMYNFYILQ